MFRTPMSTQMRAIDSCAMRLCEIVASWRGTPGSCVDCDEMSRSGKEHTVARCRNGRCDHNGCAASSSPMTGIVEDGDAIDG